MQKSASTTRSMQVVITSLQHTSEANISMHSGLLPWTLLWHPYFRSCFRRVRHDSAEYKDFIATSIIDFWEQKCHLSSLRGRDKKIIGQFYLKQLLTNMPIYQLAKFLLQSSIQHELILFKSSTVISAAHYSWTATLTLHRQTQEGTEFVKSILSFIPHTARAKVQALNQTRNLQEP